MKLPTSSFFEKTTNAQFPDHLKDPELFELVKTCQVYECCFLYCRYFIEKKIIAKPLDSKHSNDKKEEILTWRNTLLKQVKIYNDDNFNPVKVNAIDIKDNFTHTLSVQKAGRAISLSKYKNLELHLKRKCNSCDVNNYFDVVLKASQVNMGLQAVFNEYKPVTYMCQDFSKTEDQCL